MTIQSLIQPPELKDKVNFPAMNSWLRKAWEINRQLSAKVQAIEEGGVGGGDPFVGDSGTGGVEGIVPAPAAGDAASGKFLSANGSWGLPSGLVGSVAWGAITGTLTDQTDLDTALDGKSDTSHTHAYSSLTGIPATFAPSAHSHSSFTGDSGAGGAVGFVPAPVAGDAVAGKYLDADGTWTVPPVGGGGAAWGTITGTLSAQSDLNTALAGKSDTSHTHAYSSLTSIPSTFAPSAHTHVWADVTGEPTTLAGYGITDAAPLVHTHVWADVTGEPTTLAGYGITDAAPLVHTHAWADVTGEPTTLAGYGITDAQPLDTDLTALAALSTNGVMVRTGTATFAVRTITGTSGEITVTAGDGVSGNPVLSLDADIKTTMLQFVIDGGGSAITTGIKGDLYTDFNGTITSCVILADQTGSIVIDIWEDTYTNFPPLVADTITASAKPTISATNKSKDTTLTGWQKTISLDSVLRFNVDSCATITRVTISLTVTKT